MNRSVLGARNLNQVLQTALNPGDGGPETQRFGWTFRLGDPVMQTEKDENIVRSRISGTTSCSWPVTTINMKRNPLCVEGERACPPEDVGGTFGYEEYLEAMASSKHNRHKEFLGWRGPFDPEKFDANAATREMHKGLPDWRKEERI